MGMFKPHETFAEKVSPETERPEAFQIAVVFDSQEALENAEETCRFVEGKFGADLPTQKAFFSSRLMRGETAAKARAAALEADMIVVALAKGSALPQEIKTWCEQWQNLRGQKGGALVVLLPHLDRNQGSPQAFLALENTAAKAGMDFICRTKSSHSN